MYKSDINSMIKLIKRKFKRYATIIVKLGLVWQVRTTQSGLNGLTRHIIDLGRHDQLGIESWLD